MIAVVAIAAVIFKAIMSLEQTIAWIKNVLNVLMPFIIGSLIAFILNPAVKMFCNLLEKHTKLKRKGVIKGISIAITYVLLLGLVLVSVFGVVPQIATSLTDLINSALTVIPQSASELNQFLTELHERFPSLDISAIQDAVDNLLPSLLNYIRDFASNIVPTLYSLSMSIMQLLLNLVIALIVSIYILLDKKILVGSVKAAIYAFFPQKRIPYVMDTMKECNEIFGGFVIGKAIDSLIIGILCFILMTILRLPYTLLISLIVGITNMIPYFGPFIGAVPGAIIMLMVSPFKAVIFIIMIFGLQQFDGLYLGPKILGQSVGLRPLWIIVAITVGGSIAGAENALEYRVEIGIVVYDLDELERFRHFYRVGDLPRRDGDKRVGLEDVLLAVNDELSAAALYVKKACRLMDDRAGGLVDRLVIERADHGGVGRGGTGVLEHGSSGHNLHRPFYK